MGNTVIATPIKDVPCSIIIHSLFGMTEQELINNIAKYPDKWAHLCETANGK